MCLKLVSSYASHQARLMWPSPSVRLPKQLSPDRPSLDLLLTSGPKSPSPVSKYASLRLASGPVPQRLLACLTYLRLASGPAQPTRHPASGPSVYKTGLAHPAIRPSTAQPSAQPKFQAQPAAWSGCPAASNPPMASRCG